MQRVVGYIDGFNLYFGLKAHGWRDLYWLDVSALCRQLLKPSQGLVQTKYFSSRISSPADKAKRQSTYLEVLQVTPGWQVYFGHYLLAERCCRQCGFVEQVPTEKMTDVNIATELLTDAFADRFDVALLITADSDLTSPIHAIRRLFPGKRIIVAFPPDRYSVTLRRVAHGFIHVERTHVAKSQFPDAVAKPDGFVLKRPAKWR